MEPGLSSFQVQQRNAAAPWLSLLSLCRSGAPGGPDLYGVPVGSGQPGPVRAIASAAEAAGEPADRVRWWKTCPRVREAPSQPKIDTVVPLAKASQVPSGAITRSPARPLKLPPRVAQGVPSAARIIAVLPLAAAIQVPSGAIARRVPMTAPAGTHGMRPVTAARQTPSRPAVP